jgi:hypothetical protein
MELEKIKMKQAIKNSSMSITLETINDFVIAMMSRVQQNKALKGNQKKAIVIELIEYAIEENLSLSLYEVAQLKDVVSKTVSGLIDFIIFMSRNKKMMQQFAKKHGCRCLFKL